jgi:hypothetical protein
LLPNNLLSGTWEYNKVVHQLFVDFKKAYDSVRREVLSSYWVWHPPEINKASKNVSEWNL